MCDIRASGYQSPYWFCYQKCNQKCNRVDQTTSMLIRNFDFFK